MEALLRALVKRKQKSALITGEPGTGKTSLVRELAKRLLEGHPSIPTRLRDCDIFEVSPTFLRAGTTLVGTHVHDTYVAGIFSLGSTLHVTDSVVRRILLEPPDGDLDKPIDGAELVATIRRILGLRDRRAARRSAD